MEEILTMKQKEVDRLVVLKEIDKKKLTISEAAEYLQMSPRQLHRVQQRYREEGSKGVIHKSRGRRSNRGYPCKLKQRVIEIYKKHYPDYGPTLFSEMLIEKHSILLNRETVRLWLRENSISTHIRRKRPHRKKRQRRSCYGEMLQFDGSHHDWFEGNAPKCCLLNAVDDATGRVYLKFAQSENSYDVMMSLWEYVKLNGIPKSIYTDRDGVYYAKGQLTQFGRAMKELDVELIIAQSPQAKGRVERVNRTLQDRLIKALRREGICSIAEANIFLQKKFIKAYNSKFAVNTDAANVHRSTKGYDLENIFCFKTYRQVRNDYTINLSGGYVQLMVSKAPLPQPKQSVTITQWLNGQMHIFYNNQELEFKVLNEKPEAKVKKISVPAKDHPWRGMNHSLKRDRRYAFLATLG
jgi:transposase